MSLRAIPYSFLVFVLYNVVVLLFAGSSGTETDGAAAARALLESEIFSIPMISGATWALTWGDLILVIALFVLFIEILKATYTSTSSLVDHGLSMLVFIAALIEFIVVPQAATSVFFLILVTLLIDVVAGFTIGIRVARRDIGFGASE
jgi:hypothetical protein